MITIGITGTLGAGKGTVVDYLKTQGFKHYSVRAVLVRDIEKRGLEPTRDNMHFVADEFRKISPGHIMELLLAEQKKDNVDAIIESVRALGEVETLKKNAQTFYLFAVDADPKLRYDRIFLRKSSTDNVTFEKFLTDEQSEMNNSEPWKMNLQGCIKQADFVIQNNGTLQDLHTQVDAVLATIRAKK